jgi:hypothetical protein
MTYWDCDNCEFVTTSEEEADDHVEVTGHIMSWMYDDVDDDGSLEP